MPRYATLFLLFTMASIGLPGTSGFVGEFLSLAGTYQISTWAAALCTTGIILGAAVAGDMLDDADDAASLQSAEDRAAQCGDAHRLAAERAISDRKSTRLNSSN